MYEKLSLGPILEIILGLVGGFLGGQLTGLIPGLDPNTLDIGGGALTDIVGLIRNAINK